MKKWLLHVVLNAVAIIAVAQLFESFKIEGFAAALIASLILSVLNAIVRPILVVLTLPITVVSLGLFLFVINAITLMLTAWLMGSSFVIDGFGIAILSAIIISLLNLMLNQLAKEL
ncbi:phage holin family protein [Pontibacillus marinus]|uniref:Membrane protein n=1 Tax=Pontibacillus marinus BH030004 = DSM 16465 TaxID=1385511 RepID=A0A0A5HJ88_9BACI|nr:phage holin family protein [Pontibacillus marinus]KGX83717.1 membrane protein [Pontibacillus marinus BH030004 = DSM 16465]